MEGIPKQVPESLHKRAYQMASLEAFVAEIYSAYIVDNATILWILDCHEIAPPTRVYT